MFKAPTTKGIANWANCICLVDFSTSRLFWNSMFWSCVLNLLAMHCVSVDSINLFRVSGETWCEFEGGKKMGRECRDEKRRIRKKGEIERWWRETWISGELNGMDFGGERWGHEMEVDNFFKKTSSWWRLDHEVEIIIIISLLLIVQYIIWHARFARAIKVFKE